MRVVLALALALAGCGDLFDVKAPQGYACGAGNSCPPGQQCVPGEKVCRTPCTQTTMNGTIGANGQCNNLSQDNNSSNTPFNCDYDHFCRPGCSNGGNGCSGCTGTDVCDTTVSICRPACSDGCPSTWGCADVGGMNGGNNSTPSICVACRPLATSAFRVPKFAPIAYYDGATGEQFQSLAIGDLAGSGHPSVLVSDEPGGKVFVFGNDGTGVLQPPIAYPAGPSPRDLVTLDFDRDGKIDVVVGTVKTGGGGPVLLPGNGDGTLGAPVAGAMLPSVQLFTGDFLGDGKLEVGGCGGYNELGVYTTDGAGGIKALSTFANGNEQFVRCGAADFNGDKKLDMWADDMIGGVVSVFSNGATPPGFSLGPMSNFASRLSEVVFDWDGDGKADIVVGQQSPTGPMGSLASNVQLGKNMGGGFNMGSNGTIALPGVGPMVVADFDGDGHLDVALFEKSTNGKSSNVDILSGDGTTLHYSEVIAVSRAANVPMSIATGDLDGDGKPDLVLSSNNGPLAVLMNATEKPE